MATPVGRRAKSAAESVSSNGYSQRLRSLLPRLIACIAACGVLTATTAVARDSFPTRQSARVLGVRKVLRNTHPYPLRYLPVQDFDLYFSFRVGEQRYCGDYETVVLQEINDLMSSDGKDVEVTLDKSKKRVVLYTSDNRKLKAHLVGMRQCSTPVLARNNHS